MMRRARTPGMRRIAGRGWQPRDLPARRVVIHSDRLRAAGTGQQGPRPGAARAGGHGSARQPEPTSRAFPTRRAIRSHSSADVRKGTTLVIRVTRRGDPYCG
jgi:hypothetical protein